MNQHRARWRKSSRSSANGACVELAAATPGSVAVRDSKDPQSPALVFDASEWRGLVWSIKRGEHDL
jgi:Domain of unknown function (DUF397)